MTVTINGNQRIYARDAVITNGVVVGDESVSPSQAAQVIQGPTSMATPYLQVKSTHSSTPNSKIFLADNTNNVGELAIWSNNFYHVNNASGAYHYFQVHDTTGLKTVLSISASSTARNFAFGDGTVSPNLNINGAASNYRTMQWSTNGTVRWRAEVNDTAEGGSNAGSDFILARFNDAGSHLGNPISVVRSSGSVYLQSDATSAQVIVGSSSATICQLHLQSDDAAKSELVYVSEGEVSAILYVDANEDLCWARYTPKGTSVDADALKLESSTGDMILSNTSGATYAKFIIKSNNTTTGATLELHGTGGKEADLTNYNGTLYLSNRNSGAAIYFGVHDTTGDKSVAHFEATSVYRRFYFGDGTLEPVIYLNGGAGYGRYHQTLTNGTVRWQWGANNTSESGSNAGSDFNIHRYSDAGAYLGTPFSLLRSTGNAWFDNNLWVNGDLAVGDGAESDARIIIECDTSGQATLEFRADADTSAEWLITETDDLVWRRYNPKGTMIGVGWAFDSSTGDAIPYGDFFSEDWQSWSPTRTGWTSYTFSETLYKRIGNLVFVEFYISGTSNSTSTSITVPYASHSNGSYIIPQRVQNAGSWTIGYLDLAWNTSTVNFYTSMSSGGWTDSGTKTIRGSFFYQCNQV